MNPIKNLALAVDFTDHSSITLQSVISFCKESKSTLSLIHVITEFDKNLDAHTKVCNEKIDELVKRILKENILVPHVKVVTGSIEDHVVVFAEAINADAIVIGSGNHHNNKKHRLGGHAEAILRQSSVPVLIIKNNFLPLKGKIACPIDLTPSSDIVLNTAIEYAKHVGGELVIVHAVEPAVYGYPGAGLDYVYADRNFFQDEAVALETFLNTFDFKGVSWSKKILLGAPAYEVSEYIKNHPFVMTIMCSASRSGISRLILGSVAESVTRNIDCPCLVIKKSNK
jgi:universal stress protein A